MMIVLVVLSTYVPLDVLSPSQFVEKLFDFCRLEDENNMILFYSADHLLCSEKNGSEKLDNVFNIVSGH